MKKVIPVIATDLMTGEERKYTSIYQAARQLNLSYTCVHRVATGKATNASGWHFRLENTPLSIDVETYKYHRYRRPLKATNLYTNEVRIFNGCTEAAKELGLNVDVVCGVTTGRYHRAGAWTFEYVTKDDSITSKTTTNVMSPEEFAQAMQEIKAEQYDKNGDIETCHIMMDVVMQHVLKSLGYGDGIDIFTGTSKGYE